MNVTIRQFRQDDIQTVQLLLHELGYPLCAEELLCNIDTIKQRNGAVWVAESRGNVVGCLGALVHASLAEGTVGEIVSLVVAEGSRGLGIGSSLVAWAEEWLRPQVKIIRIRANTLRLQAHQFYKSLGYQEVKTQVVFIKQV